MPQPTIAGNPTILKFGGLAQPNGQGTLSQINLNDHVTWFFNNLSLDGAQQNTLAQLVWRGRAAYLAADFPPAKLKLPMTLNAAGGADFGQSIAPVVMAGEQQLTTDNATFAYVKFAGWSNRKWIRTFTPYIWEFDLEFQMREQWWRDLTATTYMNAVALTSGAATNTNVTYLGSVWAEPVWTLTIPNTNAVPIQSFRLQNTMSGDDLTVTFPGNLPASTAATVTIDSGAISVVDGNGVSYDVSGTSFALLYGPAGQVQQIRATLTPASGTATGCTLTCVATNRWLI